MPVYNMTETVKELLGELQEVTKLQGNAVIAMQQFYLGGATDRAGMSALVERMDAYHKRNVEIMEQLQAHRLDT